jgi:hypothetical protein
MQVMGTPGGCLAKFPITLTTLARGFFITLFGYSHTGLARQTRGNSAGKRLSCNGTNSGATDTCSAARSPA